MPGWYLRTCPCPRSRHRSSSWPRASPPPPCRTPRGYRPGNPWIFGDISMGLHQGITVCLMLVSPLGLGVARENEEERFVCVLSRVGHGHEPHTGVLQLIRVITSYWKFLCWTIFHLKILVRECWAVDGEASRAVPLGEVAPLHHEVLHHAVEGALLVTLSRLKWKIFAVFHVVSTS